MDLSNLVRPEFVTLTLFLVGLGSILKYRTPLDNKLIPLILFAVAYVIGASSGFVHNEEATRLYDALVGGLVEGFTATAIATFGWDMFFGLYKKGYGRKKKQ